MKPNSSVALTFVWLLFLAICSCSECRCAFAADPDPASPTAALQPPIAPADLRKQAENLKRSDPTACAALYARLAAGDTIPSDKAADLDNQADELLIVADWNTAEPLARQALDLQRQVPDVGGEAKSMRIIARILCNQGKYQEAIGLCQDAITYDRSTHATIEEASSLKVEGIAYVSLSQYPMALDVFNQALPIYRRAGDIGDEAKVLNNIGIVDFQLGQYPNALAAYQEAVMLYRNAGDRADEAKALMNTGVVYDALSQFSRALECYDQTLPVYRSVGDQGNETKALNDIGLAYYHLGQYAKALNEFDEVLPLYRDSGDKGGEAKSLLNIGSSYIGMNQYLNALDDLRQARLILHSTQDRDAEQNARMDIGTVYLYLNQPSSALDEYSQALPIYRAIGDRDGEAKALTNIGGAYDALNKQSKAVKNYDAALLIYQGVGDHDGVAAVLKSLMESFAASKNPSRNLRLATYYGKLFVNMVQSIRRSNASLDKDTRAAYVTSKAGGYRELADLLIRQGRLSEAQQVLRLLKNQEFYDFLHTQGGTDDNVAPAEPIALTPREKRWADAYDTVSTHLEDLQSRFDALSRISAPMASDKAEIASLDSRMTAASTSIATLLTRTAMSFAEPVSQQDRLPNTSIAGDVAAALKPDEVALYTIVSPDRLDLILILPPRHRHAALPKVYSSPIKQDDLYTQVYRLRSALTDPAMDPRPLAASLYDLVLGPVRNDLLAAHTKTILISLDDALRYIPPSVLYDSKTDRYVVQDYATALITLAENPKPAQPIIRHPQIIGAGVSQPSGITNSALPGVKTELEGIVHQTGDPLGSGLYPGTRMLDRQFTRSGIESDLAHHDHPIVHLASHFLLHATDADSYLLLGDGSQLSVQEIRQDPKRFADVDLLTLSACDTAMEVKSSTGREVEGLGALAQSLGARTVLASLWPVSDAETPKLMIAFYTYHRAHPRLPLPKVLRQAQLMLLMGKNSLRLIPQSPARGIIMVNAIDLKLPAFQSKPSAPDAHPYYWAPFVLIGDWR